MLNIGLQFFAYIGLKHPVFAPIATDVDGSLPTYSAGLVVGYAIAANVEIELADSKLAADDMIAEIDNSFVSGIITAGIDDISKEAYIAWMGGQETTYGGETVVRDSGIANAPSGGFGYYRVRKKNNVRTVRAYWYPKVQFAVPSEDAQTKPDGAIEWQTPEFEGSIMACKDAAASWRFWLDFTAEADAIAWLNELAIIGSAATLTSLNSALTTANELNPETYTSASWVAMANAITAAEAVVALEYPSQTRVNAALAALTDATSALVEAA